MATIEELTKRLEEMEKYCQRLEAYQACSNLMGKYSYYHSAMRHKEYVELWARRDDCLLQMPWGIYDGYEGVKTCYLQDHGDRSDPEVYQSMIGGMFVHQMDTQVLEISEDGQTARGCWISPGHETSVGRDPGHQGQREDGDVQPDAEWCWGKYAVDFIKEDGVWKFWHMRLYPMFKCNYYKCWADEQDDPEEASFPSARKPAEKPWVWSPDVIYPADQPEPPLPYRTFDDVGVTFIQ